MLTTARSKQNYPTNKYAISHPKPAVDVKKLVTNAPATFPKLPAEDHNPIIAPLPLFPNQLANIAVHEGHPTDYISPFKANKRQ